jgi:ribosomal protein S18 acetylase RimI-like enzyme
MTEFPLEVKCVPMAIDRHSPQVVAALIYESAPDLFELTLGRKTVAWLAEFVQRSHNRFSHRYVWVAENDDQILGMAIVVDAAALNQQTALNPQSDYRSVLGFWRHLRLQLAYRLLLDRILQHTFPPQTRYIANLAVHQAHRGNGIGTQLLLQCIATAKAAGANTVFISVSIDNPKAQKLYESLGFRIINTKTLRLGQKAIGTHILALPLVSE